MNVEIEFTFGRGNVIPHRIMDLGLSCSSGSRIPYYPEVNGSVTSWCWVRGELIGLISRRDSLLAIEDSVKVSRAGLQS